MEAVVTRFETPLAERAIQGALETFEVGLAAFGPLWVSLCLVTGGPPVQYLVMVTWADGGAADRGAQAIQAALAADPGTFQHVTVERAAIVGQHGVWPAAPASAPRVDGRL
jgi:hypothetical protein